VKNDEENTAMKLLMLMLATVCLSACVAPVAAPLQTNLTVAESMTVADTSGFLRADKPRQFVFPADHGPHPGFAVEWWYFTGNLVDAAGDQYGYQFTLFRSSLQPPAVQTGARSAWQSTEGFMGHFALTDVRNQQFYAYERFSRAAIGLAGAQTTPLRIWLDDWQIVATDDTASTFVVTARHGDIAINLRLDADMPPVLQGDNGLSQKSAGNASYYYSMPRLPSQGSIQIGERRVDVTGTSWLDREWSTSALAPEQIGWDWFALHLSDGSDMMVYHLRRRDGAFDPYSGGSVRHADGRVTHLKATDMTITPAGSWQSPHTSAVYPATWQLQIHPLALDITVTPLVADQELPVTVRYWEGAVQAEGIQNGIAITGLGYLEMTGYADAGRN
jgi:predicted secreted hydrolase